MDRGEAKPVRLTDAQKAALQRACEVDRGGGFCTSWIRKGTMLSQAQAYRAMRTLSIMGLVRKTGPGFWRSNDAGRRALAAQGAGREGDHGE